MPARALYALSALFLAASAAADDHVATHFSTTTDANGTIVSKTVTTVDRDHNVRVDNYVPGAATAMSSNEAGGAVTAQTAQDYLIDDSMVFRAATQRITFSDGRQCQHMSADDAPPAGYPAGGMPDIQGQLSAGQAEMDRALAELAQQDPRMAEQLRRSLEGFQNPAAMAAQRNAMEVIETGNTRTFGDYETQEFEVRRAMSGELLQTVYAAPVDSVPDGRLVSQGMLAVFGVVQQYMQNMGVEQLASNGLMGVIMEKMRDHYPILIIDHSNDERSMFGGEHGEVTVDFELDCG